MNIIGKYFSVLFLSCLLVGCASPSGNTAVDANSKSEAVNDVIMTRRSIRSYKQIPVSRDTLQSILDAGINAPSGQNKQSWEIRVADNPETMQSIVEAMALSNPDVVNPGSCFRGAPVMLFIAKDDSYPFSAIDCGLLSENIMLSAWSMGVGSICLGSPIGFIKNSPELLEMLGFSENYSLAICIGLGYPDEAPEAKPRDKAKYRFLD
ncbi:MAG: nitroreductase [Bacteroidales bacterium]|nr:nitroreductase [Bacteroidales bacterium]